LILIGAGIAGVIALAAIAVFVVAPKQRPSAAPAAAAQTVLAIPTAPTTSTTANDKVTTVDAVTSTTARTVTAATRQAPVHVGCAAQTAGQHELAKRLAHGGVTCGANISPEFAVAILKAYKDQSGSGVAQSTAMTVPSSVTGKDYTIDCTANGGRVRCHNNDSVVADSGSGGRFGANNSISFAPNALSSASSRLSSLL
jgi:hypothetical protein